MRSEGRPSCSGKFSVSRVRKIGVRLDEASGIPDVIEPNADMYFFFDQKKYLGISLIIYGLSKSSALEKLYWKSCAEGEGEKPRHLRQRSSYLQSLQNRIRG